jgi:monomeric isocitrate dehydrogenase
MNLERQVDIEQIFEDGTLIDEAMEEAFFDAVKRHRQGGVPMVFWRDGKVVHVDAHEIKLPDDPQ